MEKETLYKFFDGKASREEKEAVRIWLESSPENEQELFKEREFFDAMILSGSTKVAGMEKKSRWNRANRLFRYLRVINLSKILIWDEFIQLPYCCWSLSVCRRQRRK